MLDAHLVAIAILLVAGILAVIGHVRSRNFSRHRQARLDALKTECEAAAAEAFELGKISSTGGIKAIREEDDGGGDGGPSRTSFHDVQPFDELPHCVQDYLNHAVRDGRIIKRVTLRQSLQLRFTPRSKWLDLEAHQSACPLKPAFFFSGDMRMVPCTWATGYESLIGGTGRMAWRMWGALPVADLAGPLADMAAHVRWLSEAVCFPHALQPSRFLRWEAVEGSDRGAQGMFFIFRFLPPLGAARFSKSPHPLRRSTGGGELRRGHCERHLHF